MASQTHTPDLAALRTPDRLISVREACAILGKKKSAVYEMIKSGVLPARKEGTSNYRLSFNQLQKFIHSQPNQSWNPK